MSLIKDFTQQYTDVTNSNDFFTFDTKVVDAVYGNATIGDITDSNNINYNRLRGWYLGVDVSNIEIKNINLINYPDICNNNYQPWTISFEQIFSDKTGRQVENPHTYEFLIRYRDNITTSMRILFGTRTFDIIKINDENDFKNYITIEAIENIGT